MGPPATLVNLLELRVERVWASCVPPSCVKTCLPLRSCGCCSRPQAHEPPKQRKHGTCPTGLLLTGCHRLHTPLLQERLRKLPPEQREKELAKRQKVQASGSALWRCALRGSACTQAHAHRGFEFPQFCMLAQQRSSPAACHPALQQRRRMLRAGKNM